jgi:hypothetical protein
MWWLVGMAWAEPALTGRWVIREDAATLSARHAAAVTATLDALPWAMRPLARPLITGTVTNCRTLDVALTSERLSIACDGAPALDHARGGAGSAVPGADGKSYRFSLAVGADALQLGFDGENGGQRVRYAPQSDGTLRVTKEIYSGYLPSAVTWTVTYAREAG